MGERRYRILLVEDDAAVRTVLCEWLAMEGFAIEATANGHHALDRAAQDRYDAVLSDVKMPILGGVELTRRLKERSAVPVFLMSAQQEPSIHQADGFFSKPLNLDRLANTLRDACERPWWEPQPSHRP